MDDRSGAGINWGRVAGGVLTLASVGFVVYWLLGVDRDIWDNLRHLRPTGLIGSVLVFQFWFLLRFLAWDAIVKRHGSETQRHQSLRGWTLSELARYVPGNLWSFAAKYKVSVDGGTTRAAAIQAMAIEALSQLAGAGLIAALLIDAERWWWAAMWIIIFFPVGVPIILGLLSKWKRWGEAPRVSITESLGLLLWYALVWIVFGLATAMIYYCFPDLPQVNWTWLFGVNVAAWLIGYLSIITPMGLGVREVAFVKLTVIVLPSAVASLMAVITRLWFVLSELLFLVLVLTWHAVRRRT